MTVSCVPLPVDKRVYTLLGHDDRRINCFFGNLTLDFCDLF